MGKISTVKDPLVGKENCVIARYGAGNYTVSGYHGSSCTNPNVLHSTTGDFHALVVYDETCLARSWNIVYGCTEIAPFFFRWIYGLNQNCSWVWLAHPSSALAKIAIIKHYNIVPKCLDCTPDSCRVDCATAPDGFCCIDHAVTNRLLQTLQG